MLIDVGDRRQLIARPEHQVSDQSSGEHDRQRHDCILDQQKALIQRVGSVRLWSSPDPSRRTNGRERIQSTRRPDGPSLTNSSVALDALALADDDLFDRRRPAERAIAASSSTPEEALNAGDQHCRATRRSARIRRPRLAGLGLDSRTSLRAADRLVDAEDSDAEGAALARERIRTGVRARRSSRFLMQRRSSRSRSPRAATDDGEQIAGAMIADPAAAPTARRMQTR